MATAFVTHEDPRLDYTPAMKWAENLVAVFAPGAGQVALSPQVALAHIRRVLATMTRDDYLILVGDPVMIGMCTTVAAELVGRVKLLRWDKRSMEYFPVAVDFVSREAEAASPAATTKGDSTDEQGY